jgi:hypothetical protein
MLEEGLIRQDQLDAFKEAGEPTYLDKNISAVNTALTDDNPPTSQLTGALEENAFLASFQNAYVGATRKRCRKWAGIHSVIKADASPEGPMESQLKLIGVDVEEEFLTEVLKINQDFRNTQLAQLNPDGSVTPLFPPIGTVQN